MSLETEHYCPSCEEKHNFYRTASTLVQLGEKTKWRCPECGYGFVRIDDIESDTHATA
ncbi:DUF7838 family putative zinc beta-ribbon protein [Halocatena pleomorpha]|uniref:DUF7838 family putative zinc beta-ribbon protein n=1 Tax=Halocatena pleomorpha TaxID=1785090 RepID=UPI00163A9F16|nr:hypothetical protein [Halocatena pleomorpha]